MTDGVQTGRATERERKKYVHVEYSSRFLQPWGAWIRDGWVMKSPTGITARASGGVTALDYGVNESHVRPHNENMCSKQICLRLIRFFRFPEGKSCHKVPLPISSIIRYTLANVKRHRWEADQWLRCLNKSALLEEHPHRDAQAVFMTLYFSKESVKLWGSDLRPSFWASLRTEITQGQEERERRSRVKSRRMRRKVYILPAWDRIFKTTLSHALFAFWNRSSMFLFLKSFQ